MKRHLFLAGALTMLAACSTPVTTVKTVDARPHIAIQNASASAVLLVDGVTIGTAAAYDGDKQVLTLDSGTHKVEIRDGGRSVYAESIYLGDDVTRTIIVPAN